MAEVDFKVQKGLIVEDGNVIVKGSAAPDGTPGSSGESTVFAKMFDTSPLNDTDAHMEMSGITIQAMSNATDTNIIVTPKGSGFLNVGAEGMEGKIGQATQYDAKFTTLRAKGAVTLGQVGVDSTITQVAAAADSAGRSMTITAGSALDGGTDNTGAGGNLILQGGAGKGSQIGGSIIFNVATEGVSGDTLNNINDTALTLASNLKATFGGDVYIAGRDLFLQNSATDTGKFTSTDSLLTLTHTATNGDIAITPTGTGDLDLFTDTIDVGKATATDTTMTLRASAVDTAGRNLTITSGSTTGGSGTDNTGIGGNLLLQAGAGKGTALGGSIIFNVATAGSTGTVLNSINDTALTIASDKTATFGGGIKVASDLDSNITSDGMYVYEHTPSTNKHLRIRNNYQSDSVAHHIYIEPNEGDTDYASNAWLGKTYIMSPLELADTNLLRVDTGYIAKLEGNTNISGYTEKMSIASALGLTVGGSAINNNTIAMQVNSGANDAIGGSGSNDADYTELRLHVGVTESIWDGGDTTWDEELATLVFDNSGGDDNLQGSRGMVLSNGVSTQNFAGAWAVGTSRDSFDRFIIGRSNYHKSWDGVKGGNHSPFEHSRTADVMNEPYLTLTKMGVWETQLGNVAGTTSGGLTYTPGSFTFLRGSSHETAPLMGLALVEHTQSSGSAPTTDFDIRIYETGPGNEYTGFKAPAAISSSHIYTLPAALPASSKVLQSTDAGVLTWVEQSGGTSVSGTPVNNQLALWTAADTLEGDADLTFDGTTLATDRLLIDETGKTTTTSYSYKNIEVSHIQSGVAADTVSQTVKGAEIGVFNTGTNHAGSVVNSTGIDIDVTFTNAQGTTAAKGIDIAVSGADSNYSIYSRSGDIYAAGSATTKPDVILTNTYAPGAGSNVSGPTMQFKAIRDGSEAGKAADDLGLLKFYGNDSAGNETLFGQFKTRANAVTNTSESGLMSFAVATSGSGSLGEVMTITGGDTVASSTVTILGNLDVQGEMVTLNNTQTVVEDKTLVVGVAGGMEEATYARSSAVVTVTSASHGFSNAEIVYISNAGNSISDGVYAVSSVATNTFVLDGHGTSGTVAGASMFHSSANVTDATAADSGIHIPGATLHSMTYNATHGFRFTDDLDIGSGKHFSINGDTMLTHTGLNIYGNSTLNTNVLTWNTLGSTVVNSSLTGLGTVTSGQLGTDGSPLTAYINGGEIDGTAIGTESASTGKFTEVSVDAVAILDTKVAASQTISGTTVTTLVEFPFATYRTVKYCGHILESSASSAADDVDSFEVLISYKGTSAADIAPIYTVYAYMNSGAAPLGTLSVAATDPGTTGTNTHVGLRFTPATADKTFSWALASTMIIKQADMT